MNTKKIAHLINVRKVSIVAGIAAGSICMTNCAQANILVDAASGVIGKIRYNTTVAELVVSLLAGNGAAVTNQSWLNQLNTSYGIESSIGTLTGTDGSLGAMYEAGLFDVAADGTFIDNGLLSAIESQPAYTSCNIDDIFGTWNNAEGVAEVSGSATLGSAIGAGTTFGTLCQVAGAVTAGVHLGILANKIINTLGTAMASNLPMNTDTSYCPVGWLMTSFYMPVNNALGYPDPMRLYIYYENGLQPALQKDTRYNNYGTVIILNPKDNGRQLKYRVNSGLNNSVIPNRQVSVNSNSYYSIQSGPYESIPSGWISFYSNENINNILSGLNDGSINAESGFSPDVIGSGGNQRPITYDDPTNPLSWPNIGNQLPQDQGIKPIPWSDYSQYVDTANNNTTNNNTTINQGDTYNNFINNYIVTPDVTPAPDVEKPNYNPTVPEQPTPNNKEELTSEQAQENTDYMTTPGLKDVFPFCIPFDMVRAIKVLNTQGRQAPKITARFYFPPVGIDYNMEIDLSRFDEIASILRALELIGFVIGLAFVTRNLIGAR